MEIIKINRVQWIVLFAGIFLLLVVQSGLFSAQIFGGSFANLLLLFGIVAAIARNRKQTLAIALILGVFSDFASGLPDGVFVIAFPAVLLSLHFALNELLPKHDSIYLLALMIAGTILAFYVVTFAIIFVFELLGLVSSFSFLALARNLWIEILLNFLLFYPIFLYYQMLMKLSRYKV